MAAKRLAKPWTIAATGAQVTTLALSAYIATIALSRAATITFDDIATNSSSDYFATIPNGYSALNWTNFDVFNPSAYPTLPGAGSGYVGYLNNVVSPPNVALDLDNIPNGNGSASFISPAGSFILNSFYLGSAFRDGLQVAVTGRSNGAPVFNTSFTVNTTGPTLETLNWSGINEVDFSSSGGAPRPGYGNGGNFVLDNLTINGSTPTPTPTPPPALTDQELNALNTTLSEAQTSASGWANVIATKAYAFASGEINIL